MVQAGRREYPFFENVAGQLSLSVKKGVLYATLLRRIDLSK